MPDPEGKINFFCGFDWARHDHYFVLKNHSHDILDEGDFPNSAEEFQDFLTRLDAQRQGQSVSLIIEATRGSATSVLATIDWITLYPVNPSKTRKLIELDGSGKGKNDPAGLPPVLPIGKKLLVVHIEKLCSLVRQLHSIFTLI